jgi:hypothetical protein
MKTALLVAAALLIGVPATLSPVLAQSSDEKLTAACEDKNPGDTVMIDGQEMKCP